MTSIPLFPFAPLPPPPPPPTKKKTKKPKKTKKTKYTYALFTRLVDRSDGDRVHYLGAFPSSKDRGRRGRTQDGGHSFSQYGPTLGW